MNREIKFRGLCEDTKVFAYGDLSQSNAGIFITNFSFEDEHEEKGKGVVTHGRSIVTKVIPESVGQFTGLLDKNGKEIYEGDIVSAWSEGYNHKGEIRWRDSGCPTYIIYPAFANQGFWHLHGFKKEPNGMSINVEGRIEFNKNGKTEIQDSGVEIIGNIHDNPELLQP